VRLAATKNLARSSAANKVDLTDCDMACDGADDGAGSNTDIFNEVRSIQECSFGQATLSEKKKLWELL
jgi:hypothetical protein